MSQNKIQEHILKNWPDGITGDVCIGLSGGADSVVLLHALVQISKSKPIKLNAAHINHNISPEANLWAKFCQDFCSDIGIPLEITNITIDKNGGESLENNARIMRYKTLYQTSAPIIALAHHQNDQIETILSQIFRGSDVHNVAAMKVISSKFEKLFWRPLLNAKRSEIESYAKEYKLQYITDESNSDTTYLRNFIRHDILPRLEEWDCNITTKILNFNQQLQNLLSVTDQIAIDDLKNLEDSNGDILVDLFIKLSHERQLNVIARFIHNHNLQLPSQKQLAEFIRQASTSSWDTKPTLKLSGQANLIKHKQVIKIDNTVITNNISQNEY